MKRVESQCSHVASGRKGIRSYTESQTPTTTTPICDKEKVVNTIFTLLLRARSVTLQAVTLASTVAEDALTVSLQGHRREAIGGPCLHDCWANTAGMGGMFSLLR